MEQCLIGITGRDFVMVSADMTNAHGIIVMKADDNKLHKLSNNLVMAVCGEQGDTAQFSEYIAKNLQLYKMRNGYELGPKAAATFTRRNLADMLRSRNAYKVNLLLAGYDKQDGPQLFFIDHFASMADIKYASHGFGGWFASSIMDRYYSEDINREQAYDILKKCVREVHQRLVINLPNFKVQTIDKDGIHDMQPITAKELAVET